MPSPPRIHADASQLRQVVLNLVVNASESLEGDSGTITIETGAEDCTREMLQGPWFEKILPEGRYLYVEVRDSGRGMDEATLARVFDPFFSTKFTGRGLGLASTLGIIRGHDGAVEVNSTPGEGTSFRVRFPTVETVRVEEKPPESGEFVSGGAVLLVEDEETVRLVTQRLLESLGFVVMSFESGEEALAFFFAQPKTIRMALVDLSMPGLSGEQVLERLREKNPALPVLITSGFDEEEAARDILRQENTAFLAKPFGLVGLKQGVGRLLGEAEPESDAAEAT